ncbi:MAG TPA: substrate-binding domain-containing protein [Anaeromyxobacter sp.]|nr:substrate-binding domain-containing protein [Anaeromyxobacter sp.]
MDVRIAVASPNLGAGFAALLYSLVRKQLRPGQAIAECAIPVKADPAFVRGRLLQLLAGDPKPVALVGICLRPDPETLADYRAVGAPTILVDEELEGASTVAFDSFAGGYLAGEHLARTGRRSIAVVSGRMNVNGGYNALHRMNGFAKAMAEHRLPFSMDEVIQVREYSRRDGVNAMDQLLRDGRTVDAVFSAAGDATATGVVAAARDHRIDVPGQLAVLGYDDSPMASISSPPLTTIRQCPETLAREALRLATEEREAILARPARVLLQPTLVVRESA